MTILSVYLVERFQKVKLVFGDTLKHMQSIISFLYIKLTPVLALFISMFFGLIMFVNYKSDTTYISNSAFAIMATLAALSFSIGRCLNDSDKLRDRFIFAGERLFHATIMLIIASINKYALLSIKHSLWASKHTRIVSALDILLGLSAGIYFLYAVLSAHSGIRIINDHLWQRMSRHYDWDDII